MPKRRANGEGSLFQRKDGLWAAQYTDNAGKKRTLYGKTQQIVKEKLKEAIRQSDSGLSMDRNKIKFTDWMEEWLEVYHRPNVRKSTYAANYNRIYNHIIPAFKGILLKDLRADALQRFFNDKAKTGRIDTKTNPGTKQKEVKPGGLDVQTLMHLKSLIGQALTQAVNNDMILQDVSRRVKLPILTRKDVEILSIEEQRKFEKILLESKNPYAFPIFLDLYCGLRIGELRALCVSDIDFERGEICVQRSLGRVALPDSDGPKTKIIVGEPKTAKGKRIIPLPAFVMELLRKFVDDRNKRVEVLKSCWDQRHWAEQGYLFLTSNGRPVEACFYNKVLAELLEEAGIKQIKFHALRHTFTTRCVESGFDARTLADILGHTNISMTLNVYTHALAEQKRKNMDKLSQVYHHDTK